MPKMSQLGGAMKQANLYLVKSFLVFLGIALTFFAVPFALSTMWFQEPQLSFLQRAYKAFIELGEPLSLVVAVLSLGAWVAHEGYKKRDEVEQRKHTARYWVLYNAMNRVNQDRNVYVHIKDLMADPAYHDVRGQLDPASQHSAEGNSLALGASVLPGESSDGGLRGKLLHDLMDNMRLLLKGFERTWKNDDVLSEAMTFDFSLLTLEEKAMTLDYFEKYNTLQDEVNFVLPLLGHLKEVKDGQVAERYSGDVSEQFWRIRDSLKERIDEAIALLLVILHHGGTELVEFRKRIDTVRRETLKAGVDLPRTTDMEVQLRARKAAGLKGADTVQRDTSQGGWQARASDGNDSEFNSSRLSLGRQQVGDDEEEFGERQGD